jgi:hypothetical protein
VLIALAAADGASRDPSDPALYSVLAGAMTCLSAFYAAFHSGAAGGAVTYAAAVAGCFAAATILPLLGARLAASAPGTTSPLAPMMPGGG